MLREYVCAEGHYLSSKNKELTRCVGMKHGKPCPGPLKKIGAGSRTTTKENV